MGNSLRHDDGLACFQQERLSPDGKASGAVKHRDHGIAAGGMGGDLLSLVERKQGHTDFIILNKGLADHLSGPVFHLVRQFQLHVFLNILIHNSFLPKQLLRDYYNMFSQIYQSLVSNELHKLYCAPAAAEKGRTSGQPFPFRENEKSTKALRLQCFLLVRVARLELTAS